jgi:uncharacterized membrane protein YbhN (UPF0104 family)
VVAVVLLAPGLGEVQRLLSQADPAWLAAAAGLEALSCCSYAIAFRPVFCRSISARYAWEIAWAELAIGSIVPASGAGGLALGAWILGRGGMPAQEVARRSVAFFLLKGAVNFAAVVMIGCLLAVGAIGPGQPLWRSALPALLSLTVIAGVLALGRRAEPDEPPPGTKRRRRWAAHSGRAIIGGVREAVLLLRNPGAAVLVGMVGYWAFDNAVLWATYRSIGTAPAISVILLGYLIGQLAGALPVPGGIGAIDLGLVGTLVAYGAPVRATVAAVLAYRVILFWLPLLGGGGALWALRCALATRPDLRALRCALATRPDLRAPAP